MNKTNLIILISLLLLGSMGISACSNKTTDQVENIEKISDSLKRVNTSANYIKMDDEEELYKYADLVVIAKTDQEFKDRNHVITLAPTTDSSQPQIIEDFYTKTEITISHVIKQPAEEKYTKNESIEVIEPIVLNRKKDKAQIITTENYLELQPDNDYILYLKKNTYGEYSMINMNNGKFNLNVLDQEKEFKITGMDMQDKEIHKRMKESIMTKYKKELKNLKDRSV